MELMPTDQSWWSIPLSLKTELELPNNVATLELLNCRCTNAIGEVVAVGPCYANRYNVGVPDILCVVGSRAQHFPLNLYLYLDHNH
jgi:hypothetical protein